MAKGRPHGFQGVFRHNQFNLALMPVKSGGEHETETGRSISLNAMNIVEVSFLNQ
jgi:hypothetical protein